MERQCHRTGLPLNVTVTRKATDVLDGNVLSSQRPDLVPGVPLDLDYRTTGLWLNPAAFAVPAKGTWGGLQDHNQHRRLLLPKRPRHHRIPDVALPAAK